MSFGPTSGFKQSDLLYADKECAGCSVIFTPVAAGQKYHSDECAANARRESHRKAVNTWRNQNRALHQKLKREWDLKRVYGISLEEYETLLADQGGVCAICKGSKTFGKGDTPTFAVDHNHVTNLVRGLLCNKCNRALGLFEDDIERLLSAVLYLEKFNGGREDQSSEALQQLTSGLSQMRRAS